MTATAMVDEYMADEQVQLSTRADLPGTKLKLSRLGYGTSMLMSRLGRRQSLRLVAAALDAGITHFDTARLYGYGEAESVLGEALRGRRDRVTIATKAGILPPKPSAALSLARHVGRRVVSLNPELRARFRRAAEGMVKAGRFDIPALATSLDTSLRQLRTEKVDLLLLHECGEEDLRREELFRFLEEARAAGKITQYGLACTPEVTETALRSYPRFTPVIQFPSSVFERNLDRMHIPEECLVITHSALSSGFAELCSKLETDAALREMWSWRLGIDCGQRSAIAAMMLQYAAMRNRNGAVLFATANEQHIATSVRALENQYTRAQCDTLASLVNKLRGPAMGSGPQ